MKVDARAEAWVRLSVGGIAPRALALLLRALGSPEAVAGARPAELRKRVPEVEFRAPDPGKVQERLRASLAWLEDPAHGFVALDDPDYPRALLDIADPPPVLYCVGRRELFGRPSLAIVGSRNATPQGESDARAFAAALSGAGLTIVSGLAQGIDAAAHRGALEGRGSSVAVMGTGPDRVYPAANRDLAHALAERGLVATEFPPGTPPRKENFPRRNRLVSGLARGVLVVEATLSSGSLITARLAGEQGREVFALPGSIHSPFSRGCHRLLREGAKLVETAQDVLDELGMAARAAPAPTAPGSGDELSAAERAVLAALGHAPVATDVVVARSALPAEAVAAALVALELAGRVASVPGGLWQRRG